MDTAIQASIEQALSSLNFDTLRARAREAEELRVAFVDRFPLGEWPDLPLDRYALGRTVEGGALCWWLEWKTKSVASISGGSAAKSVSG